LPSLVSARCVSLWLAILASSFEIAFAALQKISWSTGTDRILFATARGATLAAARRDLLRPVAQIEAPAPDGRFAG
jgi:hypothetical protein